MKRPAGVTPWPRLAAACCATLGLARVVLAVAGEAPPTQSQGSLQDCASLADDASRLACYDRLAGVTRTPASPVAKAPDMPAATPAAPLPSAAAPPAASVPPPAPGRPAAAALPAAAAPVPAAPPKESFGLYAAEHPAPAAQSLEARVVGLGKSPGGRMTVALEGGQLWELDSGDPLLAVGDTVSIRRAALGSFLMETPSKRTHHAHRLR